MMGSEQSCSVLWLNEEQMMLKLNHKNRKFVKPQSMCNVSLILHAFILRTKKTNNNKKPERLWLVGYFFVVTAFLCNKCCFSGKSIYFLLNCATLMRTNAFEELRSRVERLGYTITNSSSTQSKLYSSVESCLVSLRLICSQI